MRTVFLDLGNTVSSGRGDGPYTKPMKPKCRKEISKKKCKIIFLSRYLYPLGYLGRYSETFVELRLGFKGIVFGF